MGGRVEDSLAASDDRHDPASGRIASPDVLFTIDPFIGWRRWMVTPAGEDKRPVLASTISGHRWSSSSHRAFCAPPDDQELPAGSHRAPDPQCSCGVYAYKGPLTDVWSGIGVWAEGNVMLWGRVLEGQLGYRAEHARIMAPLSVRIRCEPEPGIPGWSGILCRRRPTTVLTTEGAFMPLCSYHRTKVHDSQGLTPELFGIMVRKDLRDRYDVEVYWRGATPWT